MSRDTRIPVEVTTIYRKGRAYKVTIYDMSEYRRALEAYPTIVAPKQDSRPVARPTHATPYPEKKRKQGFQWVTPLASPRAS